MSGKPWVGVDLDGTLAEFVITGDNSIGKPVQPMVDLVRRIIYEDQIEVKIFTARVSGHPDSEEPRVAAVRIQDWLEKQCGLPRLEVTNVKDFYMVELYDDRAVQVVFNTGELVGFSTKEHRALLKEGASDEAD
jgi:hypothetical protein